MLFIYVCLLTAGYTQEIQTILDAIPQQLSQQQSKHNHSGSEIDSIDTWNGIELGRHRSDNMAGDYATRWICWNILTKWYTR